MESIKKHQMINQSFAQNLDLYIQYIVLFFSGKQRNFEKKSHWVCYRQTIIKEKNKNKKTQTSSGKKSISKWEAYDEQHA